MAEPAPSAGIPNRPAFDAEKFKELLQNPSEMGPFGFRTVANLLDHSNERSAADELTLSIMHFKALKADKQPLGPAYVIYKQLVDHIVGWSSRFGSQEAYDVAIDHWIETFKA